MPAKPGPGRLPGTLRQLPGRVPLRVKLITAVLALVAIALAVISFTGISLLGGYLLGPFDAGLQSGRVRAAASEAVQGYLAVGTAYQADGTVLLWVTGHGQPAAVVEPVQHSAGTSQLFSGTPTAMPGPVLPGGAQWLSTHARDPITVAATSGDGEWRITAIPVPGDASGVAVLGYDVTTQYRILTRLRDIDLVVSGIVLVGLAVVGVAIVRHSLRPLTDIERTAGQIASGHLSQRVPELDRRTEIGRLGRSLNVMLSQIETAFRARAESEAAARRSEERMRQFLADASHELRTPLTAIRGYAEYYRQLGGSANGSPAQAPAAGSGAAARAPAAGSGAALPGPGPAPDHLATGPAGLHPPGSGAGQLTKVDTDRLMERVEQESIRMGGLVEDMLLLARLDQQRPVDRWPVDLLTLTADAVQDARMIAPSRDISLTVSAGAAFLVLGDEARLRQVIANLMTNALTHTPGHTPIEVRIHAGGYGHGELPSSGPPSGGRLPGEPPATEWPAGGWPLGEFRPVGAPASAHPASEHPAGEPAAEAWFGEFPAATATSAPGTSAPGTSAPGTSQPGTSQPGAGGTQPAALASARHPARPGPPPPGLRQPAPAMVTLEVADQGPGLPPEQAQHVFERFYRADAARGRRTGGAGLGLAIVAALVSAHGGWAGVDTSPGRGATFWFSLPLAPEAGG